ncbi:putative coiled-coil domain-containing protein [Apostichopus japonicus]|uniref:Putative coiled-coil domain-containing protein n=1 Tax=Stichopus japonicus TaxID=307972 RepID=A0A2G8JRH0_STIJA|nr:putative coiled-coil domain-containing protein [Apostichopus japonicus]
MKRAIIDKEMVVSYFERELTKLRAQSMEESDSLDTKLNQATVKLDEKTKQLKELLKEHSKVKVELQQLQRKTISLETEVSGHQKTESKQNDQLVAVQCQLQTLEKKLTEEKQKVSELEEALSAKVDEVSEHQTHSRELDVERNRARGELQEASRQLTELQHLLQRSRAEVKEKKQLINELEEDLGQAKDEVQSKENDLQEMESVLKSSHAELEERTKQVNQFDAVVKEHQTTVEIRVKELEAELSDGKEESKRLVEQISNLEQRCFEQVQELQLQSFHKQNVESNLQSKEKEIEDKNKQIRSLEQRVERMNSDLTEEEGNNQKQNQELQMIHEQYQIANQEQIKLRKELTDAHTELLADLQRDHFQLLTLKDQQVAEVNCLKDGDAKLRGQMKYFREQENKLQAHLKAKDEMLQAANEAVVIKEAECARLSAQISGYERALYTRKANISPLSRISSAHDSPASRNNLTHSSPRVPPPPLYRSMSDSANQREPYIDSQTELNYPSYSTRPQTMPAKSRTPKYSQGLEHSETDFKQPLDINERWTGEEKISRPEEEEVNLKDQNGRDSIEGVNMASFQDMLSYVNRKMLQDGRQATQRYKISNTQGTPDRFDFGQMNRDNSSTLNKRSTLADSFVGLGVRGVPEGKPWQEELGHSLSQNGRSNQNHSSDLAGHDVSLNSMRGDLLHPRSDQFGLGNTLPFISSLLANSVESPTLSDKTGGSFPRGVDSPSSLSTRSDQDAKERPTPSQVDANKQASNRPRPPKAPSKDTSKKSVNRSLFDDTKKKGKLSTTKKHRGKIPKR